MILHGRRGPHCTARKEQKASSFAVLDDVKKFVAVTVVHVDANLPEVVKNPERSAFEVAAFPEVIVFHGRPSRCVEDGFSPVTNPPEVRGRSRILPWTEIRCIALKGRISVCVPTSKKRLFWLSLATVDRWISKLSSLVRMVNATNGLALSRKDSSSIIELRVWCGSAS